MNKAKIVTFILVFVIFASFQVNAEIMEVKNHSFEYYNDGVLAEIKRMGETPDYWEWGSGSVEGNGIEAPSSDGLVCAAVGGVDSIYQILDYNIAAGDEYTLTFDAFYLWSSGIWDCTFQGRLFYDDGGNRVPIDYVEDKFDSEDGMPDWTWHLDYTLTVKIESDSPAIGKQLGIELATVDAASGNNSWFGFDNVRMEGELGGSVKCINPPKNAENVLITECLEWGPPTVYTPLYYDLYFGSDANEFSENYFLNTPVLDKQDQATYCPPASLEYNTKYYWRVDAYEPNDPEPICNIGPVWTFTTMPAWPVITEQPQSITVGIGETAVFTVSATNVDMYEWFRVGEPDISLGSAPDMDSLEISNVQLADEGQYYCVLSNDLDSSTSEAASLWTKRLMGWWKLDGDFTDSVALEVPAAPSHNGIPPVDPNFIIDGVNGGGYGFNGDGDVIEIADSSEYFNFYPQGMTVSVWVRTATTTWDGVVAKHYRPEAGIWQGWLIDVYDDWCHFTVRGSTGDLWGSDDDGAMFDGDWHLITGVMDPVTQTSRIYVDGVQRNESGIYNMANAMLTTEPVVFGAETALGQIPYTGQIDDVRIYSYALDAFDIAELYVAFKDATICPENPSMDITGDCKVDIDDIALLALSWMECNRIPVELCE